MRWRFFARRLAMLVISLLIASFVIFAAVYLAPGNPIAALSGGRSLPPSSVRILEQRYHLNAPFFAQYWYWLDNVLHGNLGISITLRENVSTLIASRIWTTAGLVLYSSLLILVFGIGMGLVAGLRPGVLDTSTVVVTAVSRGIPGRQVIRRHVLRNAAIPITTVAGITIASLIAVAAVVETAFSLNGLGAYLVQAAQSKDLAVVQGISLLLVSAFVIVNLLVDMLYSVLDPRVSLGSRAT